jgi:hypothetical protein
VATTDATRDRVDGLCFSLGGIPVDDGPADLVTPRQMVLTEVSLVEASGSNTAPVRWQPTTLCSWNRGGYATGTTAAERQVLDHAVSRLDFQQRAGVIEVITLPERHPASVAAMARSHRARDTVDTIDPFGPTTNACHPRQVRQRGANPLLQHRRMEAAMTSEGFGNWHDTADDGELGADLDDMPTIHVAAEPDRWPPRSSSWDHMQQLPPDWNPSLPVVW